jgi:N-acetylneuraminate synthase
MLLSPGHTAGAQLFHRRSAEQCKEWLDAWCTAQTLCGPASDIFREPSEDEVSTLRPISRGVYAKADLASGQTLTKDNVEMRQPLLATQLSTQQFREGMLCATDVSCRQPLAKNCSLPDTELAAWQERETLFEYIHSVKAILRKAKVHIGFNFEAEVSHHYGIQNLSKFGCIILSMFNNQRYCRKLLVQTAGQYNPFHYHMIKDETFTVISGKLKIFVEKNEYVLSEGEHLRVAAGLKHAFQAMEDTVVEEVSSEAISTDSYYLDPAISKLPRSARKHALPVWALL